MGPRDAPMTPGSEPAMGWFFVVEGEKKDMKGGLAQDGAVHPEVAKTSTGSPK